MNARNMLFLTATWSVPGRLMEPMLKRIAREYRLPMTRLLVDDHPELVRRHGLRGLPTLFLIDGGTVIRRWDGFRPEIEIRRGMEESSGGGAPRRSRP